MRHVCMLFVIAAMVFVAAGLSRGSTNPGPLLLDSAAGSASRQSSLSMMEGGKSPSTAILPAAREFQVAQLFVAATAADGEKNPPPRSAHCPPDKDDHHDSDQKRSDNQNKDNQDKDSKDKDHHDNCGKGDDSKNP